MGNWLSLDLVEPCGKTVEGQKVKRNQDEDIGNAKKRPRTSKRKENPSNNSINRMDEAFLRFPHLPEQIMEELDFKSLTNSRLLAISLLNGYQRCSFESINCFQEIATNLDFVRLLKSSFSMICSGR